MLNECELTDAELEQLTDKSLLYGEKFFVSGELKAVATAATRKALTWAVSELCHFNTGNMVGDEWFSLAAVGLTRKLSKMGIEPWPEEQWVQHA